MVPLFDNLINTLSNYWKAPPNTRSTRAFHCVCGQPVYFLNTQCLSCKRQLGYAPRLGELRALSPVIEGKQWQVFGDESQAVFRRCGNFDSAAKCNWLVPAESSALLCVSCALNRKLADLSDEKNQNYWRKIENEKRRVVSQLLGLGLPVVSKAIEPETGLAFDLLRSPDKGPRVMTGHATGLITLNIEEADDAIREKIRTELNEPYRTLLGHLRHEVGHYYWDRLIWNSKWLEPFRELFGDEREDYAAALKANYATEDDGSWKQNHISRYAAAHAWEDWAETWAHYLHLVDSMDTAIAYGLNAAEVEPDGHSFTLDDLYDPEHANARQVLVLLNSWMDMIHVLNELARSLGQRDFYPFTMPRAVVKKLHFISLVLAEYRQQAE